MDFGVRLRLEAVVSGLALSLLAGGCLPLPVHVTPAVAGQVLDDVTGQPVPGAVVVVRFDSRHDDLLPDRDLLGHREVVSDEEGRFHLSRATLPGLSAWPMIKTEARVVSAIKPGYRCASPRGVPGSGRVTLRLTPAPDDADRRASCRPVAARASETPRYLAAWRGLYPRDGRSGRLADQRQLTQILDARGAFGPGENCSGPVVDLSLAPGGSRVALTLELAGQRTVEVVELQAAPQRVARIPLASEAAGRRARRLAWASGGELVLWEPASALDRTLSPSLLSVTGAPPQVVWRGAMPPASRATRSEARVVPIEPTDLNDESHSRWLGRSFLILRSLDPVSGRASESMRVQTPGGEESLFALPGESCGPTGQYGRPHSRISADGQFGLDLRHVEGGCHAVVIHLTSGDWRRLDGSAQAGVCNETRRVPLAHLRAALRGWMRDLEESLAAAGGDPGAAYSLLIGHDGRTLLHSRDVLGERLELVVSSFPIETPLRRIDVTGVGNAGDGSASQPAPVLEPL